jgi:hypothetical protein
MNLNLFFLILIATGLSVYIAIILEFQKNSLENIILCLL